VRTSLVERRAVERLLLLVGALRSGLIDALAGSGAPMAAGARREALSLSQVTAAAGTDPRASRVVLAALAAEGIVEEIAGPGGDVLYRLTPLGRAHLVDEGPDLERSGLIHEVNKLRGWLELPEVIRTGRPASGGMARRDIRSRARAQGERDPGAPPDPAVLAEVVERCLAYAGPIRSMIDVGGSVGHLAREFARRGVKSTLFDKDEVLPIAREFLGAEGETMTLLGGDLTVALPAGPFDLVYFGNVLHIYSPETNVRAVCEAFSVTSPGGTIAIQDYVWGHSRDAAMFAVNMLRSTDDGGVWTEEQHREWLTGAGFAEVEVLDLETTGGQLVLGRRPAGL
jgi:SAM-dependent methyltransferase